MGPVSGENDAKGVVATLTPAPGDNPPLLSEGTLVLRRTGSKLRVWKNPQKGAGNGILVAGDTKTWDLTVQADRNDFSTVRSSLRAEGYQDGTSSLVLEYKDPEGNVVVSDTVNCTFIAALCGRQPTPDARTRLSNWHPNLVHCQWSILAPEDPEDLPLDAYNCMAWSVGETNIWYNPWTIDMAFGDDDGLFEDSDVDSFYANKKGWSRIENGSQEERADDAKCMYYSYGEPWDYVEHLTEPPSSGFHAARTSECSCGAGKWIMYTSKLGKWELVEHVWDQLDSTGYGAPDIFYE